MNATNQPAPEAPYRTMEIGLSRSDTPRMFAEFVEWVGTRRKVASRRNLSRDEDTQAMAYDWIRNGNYPKTVIA